MSCLVMVREWYLFCFDIDKYGLDEMRYEIREMISSPKDNDTSKEG